MHSRVIFQCHGYSKLSVSFYTFHENIAGIGKGGLVCKDGVGIAAKAACVLNLLFTDASGFNRFCFIVMYTFCCKYVPGQRYGKEDGYAEECCQNRF